MRRTTGAQTRRRTIPVESPDPGNRTTEGRPWRERVLALTGVSSGDPDPTPRDSPRLHDSGPTRPPSTRTTNKRAFGNRPEVMDGLYSDPTPVVVSISSVYSTDLRPPTPDEPGPRRRKRYTWGQTALLRPCRQPSTGPTGLRCPLRQSREWGVRPGSVEPGGPSDVVRDGTWAHDAGERVGR